jgi:hypothetical protein
MNSCIKTIQLYYEISFVINVALNSDWVRRSLYVSLGSHRYGTLKGNLAYVPVMDPGFGSWHSHKSLINDSSVANYHLSNTTFMAINGGGTTHH